MRSRRCKKNSGSLDRPLLFVLLGLISLFAFTVNCSLVPDITGDFATGTDLADPSPPADPGEMLVPEKPLTAAVEISELLWADALLPGNEVTRPAHTEPSNISLNVRDAGLLDVLSMLAFKLDANIIFLGEEKRITIKSQNLSPLVTLQLVLQSEGLDYLTVGRNYIVAGRDRLYGDFTNRMLLSRFELAYVSAEAMEGYLRELSLPVQSLTIDSNRKALWMQGTPLALGKARELINTLDVRENAAFGVGGSRKIRMPVATATGGRAEEELEALIDLLSILLDGFRDDRIDMGWVTWDHPDPIPYIYMDWDDPVVRPYDIKMKITRDFVGDYTNQLRYLIAEGTPDNIELVRQMITAIGSAPPPPFSFDRPDEPVEVEQVFEEEVPAGGANHNLQEYTPEFTISLSGVPPAGGTLLGGGSYRQGTMATVTAEPASGYSFLRWIEAGAEVSVSNRYSFPVYRDRELEAVFITGNDAAAGNGSELP